MTTPQPSVTLVSGELMCSSGLGGHWARMWCIDICVGKHLKAEKQKQKHTTECWNLLRQREKQNKTNQNESTCSSVETVFAGPPWDFMPTEWHKMIHDILSQLSHLLIPSIMWKANVSMEFAASKINGLSRIVNFANLSVSFGQGEFKSGSC